MALLAHAFMMLIFTVSTFSILYGIYTWLDRNKTLWLDESLVSIALQEVPKSGTVIGEQLTTTQVFPRLLLTAIRWLGSDMPPLWDGAPQLGFRTLPVCFGVLATVLWSWSLWFKTRHSLVLGLFAASLLLNPVLWIIYAGQFKQYSFELLMTIIILNVSNAQLDSCLLQGRRRLLIPLITLPIFLSYTYPIVLLARLLAWWISQQFTLNKLHQKSVAMLLLAITTGFISIYYTDHRPNFTQNAGARYWETYLLLTPLKAGEWSRALALFKEFLFYWYYDLPSSVVIAIELLFVAGTIGTVVGWLTVLKGRAWSSESVMPEIASNNLALTELASISLLLLSVISVFSLLGQVPLCPGRVLLFTQFSSQVLVVFGLCSLLTCVDRIMKNWKVALATIRFVSLFVTATIAICSVSNYMALLSSPMNRQDLKFIVIARPEMRGQNIDVIRMFNTP